MKPPKSRAGFTLIEVVFTVLISSMLLLMMAQVLISAMKVSSLSNDHLRQQQTIARFMRDFRSDLCVATKVSYDLPQQTIEMVLLDGSHVLWKLSAQNQFNRFHQQSVRSELYQIEQPNYFQIQTVHADVVWVTLHARSEFVPNQSGTSPSKLLRSLQVPLIASVDSPSQSSSSDSSTEMVKEPS